MCAGPIRRRASITSRRPLAACAPHVAFADPPKLSAGATLRELQAHGVTPVIITGDNEAVTRHLCSVLGLPAAVMPLAGVVGPGELFAYCNANPGAFHRADAAGYVFWSDRVLEIDPMNPQLAARLARAMDRWKKLAEPLRSAAREAIARVAAKPDLSNDVREVVSRALAE